MSDALGIGIRYEGPEKFTAVIEKCARSHGLEFCDVSGFGELEWMEIEGKEKNQKRRFQGPFQLVSLRGRLRVVGEMLISDFMCTVARDSDNGIQMLGGVLLDAELRYLELTFVPLSSSEVGESFFETQSYAKPLIEESHPRPQSEGDRAETPREPPPAVPDTRPAQDLDERWSQAIAESNRIRKTAKESADGDGPEERPRLGDVVIHRQFGRCKVTRMGDSHITLRKPDSRNVQLGLSILKFERQEDEEDGKAVYSVMVRPRR